MNDHLTTAQLIEVIRTARSDWEALLAEVSAARLTEPGVEGDWSMKDIIAHITYYESWVVDCLTAIQHGGPLPQLESKGLDIDQRNAIVYARNRGRPLAEVLRDSQTSFNQSVDLVQRLRDEDLYDPEFTRQYSVEWTLHDLIEGDTYEHYRDHMASVRTWLEHARATV
jgi:hypothetical protein